MQSTSELLVTEAIIVLGFIVLPVLWAYLSERKR